MLSASKHRFNYKLCIGLFLLLLCPFLFLPFMSDYAAGNLIDCDDGNVYMGYGSVSSNTSYITVTFVEPTTFEPGSTYSFDVSFFIYSTYISGLSLCDVTYDNNGSSYTYSYNLATLSSHSGVGNFASYSYKTVQMTLRNYTGGQIVCTFHLDSHTATRTCYVCGYFYDPLNTYDLGYSAGYDVGYTNGKAINTEAGSQFMMTNAVNAFLQLEIFPGFHIYTLLILALGLAIFGLFVKMFLGG